MWGAEGERVEVGEDAGEEGLQSVEGDGVVEDFWGAGGVGRRVGVGCYAFLEDAPGEAGWSRWVSVKSEERYCSFEFKK